MAGVNPSGVNTPQSESGAAQIENPVPLSRQELDAGIQGEIPAEGSGERGKAAGIAARMKLVAGSYYALMSLIAIWVLILCFRTSPAMHSSDDMPTMRGFILWFAPILAGAIVVYYMLKPILAQRKGPVAVAEDVSVRPDTEPVLCGFLEKLARAVRSKAPSRIQLSGRPEIRVTEMGGPESGTGLLEVRIGLPLVSNLNVKQLGGLIARELALHRQSPREPAREEIARYNAWLDYLITFRSSFDESIEELAQTENKWLKPFALFTKYAVWLVRCLVRGIIVRYARSISSDAMCQRQLDADAAGAAVAGAQDYAVALNHIPVIEAAVKLGMGNLARTVQINGLPANYPAFITERMDVLSSGDKRKAQDALNAHGKEPHSLVPAHAERLRTVARVTSPGIITVDRPAASLFHDYAGTCVEVTSQFYEQAYGQRVQSVMYIDNPQFYERFTPELAMKPLEHGVVELNERDSASDLVRYAKIAGAAILTATILFAAVKGLVMAFTYESPAQKTPAAITTPDSGDEQKQEEQKQDEKTDGQKQEEQKSE